MSQSIRTEFSADSFTSLEQAIHLSSLLSAWSAEQNREGWLNFGSYVIFPGPGRYEFRFLVVSDRGLTQKQKQEVIAVISDSGLRYLSLVTDPRPAS